MKRGEVARRAEGERVDGGRGDVLRMSMWELVRKTSGTRGEEDVGSPARCSHELT